jgi:hypothetical protein
MASHYDVLDYKILSLSESDDLRFRDLWGVGIFGAPGSGKSTTVGKQLAYGLLRMPHSGGLILTAKSEETHNWIAYARACGREKDLIIFNAGSGHCFDPLHHEYSLRKDRGIGDMEATIHFFSMLGSIGHTDIGQGHDPFWRLGNQQLMRNCIKLLDLAGERISIASIDRVIKSLPTRPDEHEEGSWQSQSYCAQLIAAIKDRKDTLTEDQWSDLDFATQFIFRKWPEFDERPRSSLAMTWAGMADKFLFNPFNRLFCSGKCTFTPEQTTHEGKIVICDFPLLEYGHETGMVINVILKLIFQKTWLRRDLSQSPNPVFLWQDEFHYFVVPTWDNFFQQTCRGSCVAVVCLTQNILNLSETLGENQPGSKTKSFLGNLGLKIFLQQNDIETCIYASDQIGKEYRYVDNYNASSGNHQTHASVGGSQQLVHLIEPIEFTRLLKPDSSNPYAQGIVYQSGKSFNATKTENNPAGCNYLSVYFSRE